MAHTNMLQQVFVAILVVVLLCFSCGPPAPPSDDAAQSSPPEIAMRMQQDTMAWSQAVLPPGLEALVQPGTRMVSSLLYIARSFLPGTPSNNPSAMQHPLAVARASATLDLGMCPAATNRTWPPFPVPPSVPISPMPNAGATPLICPLTPLKLPPKHPHLTPGSVNVPELHTLSLGLPYPVPLPERNATMSNISVSEEVCPWLSSNASLADPAVAVALRTCTCPHTPVTWLTSSHVSSPIAYSRVLCSVMLTDSLPLQEGMCPRFAFQWTTQLYTGTGPTTRTGRNCTEEFLAGVDAPCPGLVPLRNSRVATAPLLLGCKTPVAGTPHQFCGTDLQVLQLPVWLTTTPKPPAPQVRVPAHLYFKRSTHLHTVPQHRDVLTQSYLGQLPVKVKGINMYSLLKRLRRKVRINRQAKHQAAGSETSAVQQQQQQEVSSRTILEWVSTMVAALSATAKLACPSCCYWACVLLLEVAIFPLCPALCHTMHMCSSGAHEAATSTATTSKMQQPQQQEPQAKQQPTWLSGAKLKGIIIILLRTSAAGMIAAVWFGLSPVQCWVVVWLSVAAQVTLCGLVTATWACLEVRNSKGTTQDAAATAAADQEQQQPQQQQQNVAGTRSRSVRLGKAGSAANVARLRAGNSRSAKKRFQLTKRLAKQTAEVQQMNEVMTMGKKTVGMLFAVAALLTRDKLVNFMNIASLQNMVQRLKHDTKNSTQKLKKSDAAKKRAEKTACKLEEFNGQLLDTNQQLGTEVKGLEGQLTATCEAHARQCKKQRKVSAAKDKEIKKLRQDVSGLKQKARRLENKNTGLLQDKSQLQQENQALHQQLSATQSSSSSVSETPNPDHMDSSPSTYPTRSSATAPSTPPSTPPSTTEPTPPSPSPSTCPSPPPVPSPSTASHPVQLSTPTGVSHMPAFNASSHDSSYPPSGNSHVSTPNSSEQIEASATHPTATGHVREPSLLNIFDNGWYGAPAYRHFYEQEDQQDMPHTSRHGDNQAALANNAPHVQQAPKVYNQIQGHSGVQARNLDTAQRQLAPISIPPQGPAPSVLNRLLGQATISKYFHRFSQANNGGRQ